MKLVRNTDVQKKFDDLVKEYAELGEDFQLDILNTFSAFFIDMDDIEDSQFQITQLFEDMAAKKDWLVYVIDTSGIFGSHSYGYMCAINSADAIHFLHEASGIEELRAKKAKKKCPMLLWGDVHYKCELKFGHDEMHSCNGAFWR